MRIKNTIIYLLASLSFCVMLASCTSHKKIAYLQGTSPSELYKIQSQNFNVKYAPEDVLTISVVATVKPSLTNIFNTPNSEIVANPDALYPGSVVGRTYEVNDKGQIDFPVLGLIKIAGLTKDELEKLLRDGIKKFIVEDPIITIKLVNYNITVLGEVNRPGAIRIERSRVNLYEAIALAGDLTISGRRANIKLMRKDANNEIRVEKLDLTSKEILTSPYFYLQQNDLLYVEPDTAKSLAPDRDLIGFWFSIWSMTFSLFTVVLLLINNY